MECKAHMHICVYVCVCVDSMLFVFCPECVCVDDVFFCCAYLIRLRVVVVDVRVVDMCVYIMRYMCLWCALWMR